MQKSKKLNSKDEGVFEIKDTVYAGCKCNKMRVNLVGLDIGYPMNDCPELYQKTE